MGAREEMADGQAWMYKSPSASKHRRDEHLIDSRGIRSEDLRAPFEYLGQRVMIVHGYPSSPSSRIAIYLNKPINVHSPEIHIYPSLSAARS